MKNEQPALVILIPGFPKDEEDSTCLPAQQAFIKSVNDNFPLVKIIVLSFQYPFVRKEYNWNNNQVIAFGGKNKGGLSRLLLWRRVRQTFATLNKQENIIGIVSFWCGECALLGKQLSRMYDLKHYCWIMGQDAGKKNKYVKRIRPEANDLIAISDFIREGFSKNYSITPQHIIPIGIDAKEFEIAEPIRDIDILGVGSLISLKQYDVFINAIKELKKSFPTIKTIICGKGPEETRLKLLIEELDLMKNIELVGEKSHQQVLQLMKRSKVFLHPSYYEGFSGVCLEALYAGAHIISFCKPMEQEINHWHIVKDVSEMKEKTLSLLGSSLSHEPVSFFSIEETTQTVMKLFGF